mmetsp:Transcript_18985/g.35246  ORF Transcript_18985/g.35246 Transcript_18985/m.35246 type:complete len:587 (+) Transcript_18985:142-1902(+)
MISNWSTRKPLSVETGPPQAPSQPKPSVTLMEAAKATSPQSERLNRFSTDSGSPPPPLSPTAVVVKRLWGGRETSKRLDEDSMNHSPYMLHPASDFRRRWNLLALAVILYTSIDLPMDIAFFPEIEVNAGFIVNCIFDAFFIIDIFINFRTGFEFHGRIVMDDKASFQHYLHNSFLYDCIASIPVDYFAFLTDDSSTSISKAPKIIRILRMFRLIRLLRLPRLFRYTKGYASTFHTGYVRVVKLLFLLLLFAHWNACLLFLVASLQSFGDQTWVGLMDLEDEMVSTQYSWSLFMSLSHMLCIGYGVYPPETLPELWAIIFSMSLGASLFACIVGSLTAVLLSLDSSNATFTAYMNELEAYFNHRAIDSQIRLDCLEYLKLRFGNDEHQSLNGLKMYSEKSLLSALPDSLKRKLRFAEAGSLLSKNPIFNASFFPKNLQDNVASKLVPEWHTSEEIICREGDLPTGLWFVKSGSVEITCDGEKLGQCQPGSFFGEGLISNCLEPLTYTTGADNSTVLFKLSREAYLEVVKFHPDLLEILVLVCQQKMKKLNMEDWKKDRSDSAQLQKERVAQLKQLFDDNVNLTPKS